MQHGGRSSQKYTYDFIVCFAGRDSVMQVEAACSVFQVRT